ncbi:unnamed protein product [Pleuronectes platessa]|uniref:Uncharacterized protein n=1 Tax=Pleuronectes platessa TaxID=8262 RepID=A0A9N7Y4M8_PLEPL|nr:unnamed protein product [Pleuronectes platessa]
MSPHLTKDEGSDQPVLIRSRRKEGLSRLKSFLRICIFCFPFFKFSVPNDSQFIQMQVKTSIHINEKVTRSAATCVLRCVCALLLRCCRTATRWRDEAHLHHGPKMERRRRMMEDHPSETE